MSQSYHSSSSEHARAEAERTWATPSPIPAPIGNPWRTCLNPLLEEDRVKCEAWKDEVQNLLLFAGLFSAVVTAFVVQSYQYLQPNPDPTMIRLLLLSRITTGLEQPGILDSQFPDISDYPTASTVRVNIYWFTSLILSLMTVLVGIVALQWIREYQKYPTNLLPKRAFAVRNLRAESLEQWYVPEIFAGLPLLLQAALVLFLVGLADFLLHLNSSVAWPAIVMIGTTLLFLIATTALPFAQALWLFNTEKSTEIPVQCPYKSPQSWAFFRITSSRSFRFVLNLIADFAFYTLVTPVSGLLMVAHLLGQADRFWSLLDRLHVTLKLKTLGRLREWSELDGFWMDERQRLYTQSTEPTTFFQKAVGHIDCDAARGLAHVVDGRANEDHIAVAIYHCFQELPGTVIGDDIFQLMTQRLPTWTKPNEASRMLPQTSPLSSQRVKDENEFFLLGRLPQTGIAMHFFARRQLQLFTRLLGYIFVDRNYSTPKNPSNLAKKAAGTGKLRIPTCLVTVQRAAALPRPLLLEIQQQLIEVFQGLVHKAITLEHEIDSSEFCFQSEQVLGDFMQLMRIMTMSALGSPKDASNTNTTTVSSLERLVRILDRQVNRRGATSRRPAVHLAILYISRFEVDDWALICQLGQGFSGAYKALVESLDEIGLTSFNFNLHRAFYRKRCQDVVNQIRGQTNLAAAATVGEIQLLVEVLPQDLEDMVAISAYRTDEEDEESAETSSIRFYKEEQQALIQERGLVDGQRPRYPERVKIRSPTTGRSVPPSPENGEFFGGGRMSYLGAVI